MTVRAKPFTDAELEDEEKKQCDPHCLRYLATVLELRDRLKGAHANIRQKMEEISVLRAEARDTGWDRHDGIERSLDRERET